MRIVLDNNLAPRNAVALNALLEPQHEVHHLRKYCPGETTDVAWLTKLSSEESLVVVSGDEGIFRKPLERRAWKDSGLTLFFLKPGWINLDLFVQHAKLTMCIRKIVDAAVAHPRGKGFSVAVSGTVEELPVKFTAG